MTSCTGQSQLLPEKNNHKEIESPFQPTQNHFYEKQEMNHSAPENKNISQINIENFEETIIECEASFDEMDESPKPQKERKNKNYIAKSLSLKEIEEKGETEREIKKKLKNTPYVSLQNIHCSSSEKKLSIGELVSSPETYFYENTRPKIQDSAYDDSSKFEFNYFKISRTPSQATIGGFNNYGNKSHFGTEIFILV